MRRSHAGDAPPDDSDTAGDGTKRLKRHEGKHS
jgi:hypothetical protein